MSTTSNSISETKVRTNHPKCHRPFRMTSRRILLAAGALVAAGYIMMSGPGSTDEAFNPDIFSTRRTVIAPSLCLAGYLLTAIGILRRK